MGGVRSASTSGNELRRTRNEASTAKVTTASLRGVLVNEPACGASLTLSVARPTGRRSCRRSRPTIDALVSRGMSPETGPVDRIRGSPVCWHPSVGSSHAAASQCRSAHTRPARRSGMCPSRRRQTACGTRQGIIHMRCPSASASWCSRAPDHRLGTRHSFVVVHVGASTCAHAPVPSHASVPLHASRSSGYGVPAGAGAECSRARDRNRR